MDEAQTDAFAASSVSHIEMDAYSSSADVLFTRLLFFLIKILSLSFVTPRICLDLTSESLQF